MYADDNNEYFPSRGPPNQPVWWSPGPFKNSLGFTCGGEWFASDGKTPNTPAPMIEAYLNSPLAWVCPKRKRGLTYTKAHGTFNPTITGFLSYGFNELGCFCLADAANGTMQTPTPRFKASSASRPSQPLCVTEVSGSNNPGDCNGNPGPGSGNADTFCGDAAWLDAVWESNTGPNQPVDSENGRLQTAWGKHNNMVNVLYVDGHNESTLVGSPGGVSGECTVIHPAGPLYRWDGTPPSVSRLIFQVWSQPGDIVWTRVVIGRGI